MLKLLFIEHIYAIIGIYLFSWLPNYFIRYVSVVLSVIFFNHSLLLLVLFNSFSLNYQFELSFNIASYDMLLHHYTKVRFGLDGLSIFFLLITSFMLPGALLYSKHYLEDIYLNLYTILLFLLNLLLYSFFSVLNFLFFYVCFEFILVPIFFLIIFWGPRYKRSLAGIYMFMYTFIGSLFFFIFLIFIFLSFRTFDFEQIFLGSIVSLINQKVYWSLCFITFAVKVPMMPVHLWLPEAHVEAPTVGSVYLASLLLKLGGYGLIRVLYQWLTGAWLSDLRLFGKVLSICSFLYCTILIFSQIDLKKIIAYSSIIHMNFALFGLFCSNSISVFGCIYMLLGHSLISGALFYLVGMLYDRTKSRFIFDYSSLFMCMPVWSFFFFFFSISNAGFPGTVNFISELLLSVGIIVYSNQVTSSILGLTVLLVLFFGIWYSLLLVNRIIFGGTFKGLNLKFLVTDLTLQEILVLLPILLLTIYFGVSNHLIYNNVSGYVEKYNTLINFTFILVLPIKSLHQFLLRFYVKDGELFIVTLPKMLIKLITILKYSSYFVFNQLVDIVGIDMNTFTRAQDNMYSVSLVSLNLLLSLIFNLRAYVWVWNTDTITSLEHTFINATWLERENWDLFGIKYTTRDLRRILTNYGFEGFPFRKVFPLIGYIEFYFNIALNCIMTRPVDQSQGFRFYTVNDLWWPNKMTNLFTFVVLLESSPAKYNFEIIYFVLILLTSIFTLLPYIRNLIHGILLIVISFLLFIFTLLYLDYEFVAVLILILYVGSILLIILYVIAILNNGVLLDSSLFKAYSIERWVFFFLSIKFFFFGQLLFSTIKMPSVNNVDVTTDYFQSCFSTLDDSWDFTIFFSDSNFLVYTFLISFVLLLALVVLTLIAAGWRYSNSKSKWY